jgi:hypothetical protein
MSEAELHVLRARLIGGMLNKARRGELHMRIPIGFVYEAAGRVDSIPTSRSGTRFASFSRPSVSRARRPPR